MVTTTEQFCRGYSELKEQYKQVYNDIRLAGVAWGGLAVLLQIIFALSFVFLIIFALIGFVMKKLFNIHSSLLASIFGGLGIKGELLLLLHFLHL